MRLFVGVQAFGPQQEMQRSLNKNGLHSAAGLDVLLNGGSPENALATSTQRYSELGARNAVWEHLFGDLAAGQSPMLSGSRSRTVAEDFAGPGGLVVEITAPRKQTLDPNEAWIWTNTPFRANPLRRHEEVQILGGVLPENILTIKPSTTTNSYERVQWSDLMWRLQSWSVGWHNKRRPDLHFPPGRNQLTAALEFTNYKPAEWVTLGPNKVRPIVAAHITKTEILDVILSAQRTLDIATHALDDVDYEVAIRHTAQRGVCVRILFSDPSSGGRPESEARIFRERINALRDNANIQIISYNNAQLQPGTSAHKPGQHAKLILADASSKDARGYIGDAALYTWEENSSAGYDWYNSVGAGLRIDGPWVGELSHFFHQLTKQVIPATRTIQSNYLQLLASRNSEHSIRTTLLEDIANASESITVLQYCLQHKEIVQALIDLKRTRPSVDIRVYLGRKYRKKKGVPTPFNVWSYVRLRSADIDVRFTSDGLFVHGKAVFVDDISHVGSADLTHRGLTANIEANVRIQSKEIADVFVSRIRRVHDQGLAPRVTAGERAWANVYRTVHKIIRCALWIYNH